MIVECVEHTFNSDELKESIYGEPSKENEWKKNKDYLVEFINKNVLIFLAIVNLYRIWVPYSMNVGKGSQVIINQEKLIDVFDIS